MRHFTLLLIFLVSLTVLNGQTVTLQRIADLMPQNYSITGDAFLEQLDNGILQIRLSSDFDTPSGPDIRILLGNSLSLNGTEEIVNLSDINHFSGANTFPVPAGIAISDYNNILFFCVSFQQFWASGTFGATMGSDTTTCSSNSISLLGGESAINICPSDNQSDILSFSNSLGVAPGSRYAYLLTDQNDILEAVIDGSSYDFEGSSTNKQRMYGIHYSGTLAPAIGLNRMNTFATTCFEHSTTRVTILKENCDDTFECMASLTATTDWASSADICSSDGIDDIIELRNNLFIPPGDHYAYLITDANQTVLDVTLDSLYNFEGSLFSETRVYGVHYDGQLNPALGEDRSQTTASGCFIHSGDNLFLTITKTACDTSFECIGSLTATHAWVTEIDICATDGTPDNIFIQNNIATPPGPNYVFLLTDSSEVLQEVIFDTTYNFEGTGIEEQRVYGLSFSGQLSPQIGEPRRNTIATGCFMHSGDNLFMRINKQATCVTPTNDLSEKHRPLIYPNPTSDFFNIRMPSTANAIIENVQVLDIKGQLIMDSTEIDKIRLEQIGIYLLRINTDKGAYYQRVVKF